MLFLRFARETIREFAAVVYVFQFDINMAQYHVDEKREKRHIFSPIDTKMHVFPPIESFEA